MGIISSEEWQEIKNKIDYGLEHYGDNVAELIKIYKSIKTVLTDHGFNPNEYLTNTSVKEYPLIISQSFLELENKIKELNGTIIKYEGNFSDIADAIIARGVDVETTITGLGAFNSNGYLAGDVVIPEGVTNMKRGVVY